MSTTTGATGPSGSSPDHPPPTWPAVLMAIAAILLGFAFALALVLLVGLDYQTAVISTLVLMGGIMLIVMPGKNRTLGRRLMEALTVFFGGGQR